MGGVLALYDGCSTGLRLRWRVDPDTRTRVEKAMDELGYRPHRAARALRTGRSQTIGLVVTTLATVGNSRMLQATVDFMLKFDLLPAPVDAATLRDDRVVRPG